MLYIVLKAICQTFEQLQAFSKRMPNFNRNTIKHIGKKKTDMPRKIWASLTHEHSHLANNFVFMATQYACKRSKFDIFREKLSILHKKVTCTQKYFLLFLNFNILEGNISRIILAILKLKNV